MMGGPLRHGPRSRRLARTVCCSLCLFASCAPVEASSDLGFCARRDAGLRHDGACTELWLDPRDSDKFQPRPGCPIDPDLPECKAADTCAIVARTEMCWDRLFCVPVAVNGWSESVLLWDPFGGCDWPIVVDSVLDCGDHVRIEYSVVKPCNSCDERRPSWHSLVLRWDPKPVHGYARLGPCK